MLWPSTSNQLFDLRASLQSAHCVLNRRAAIEIYRDILEYGKPETADIAACVSDAARELALMAQTPRERADLWKRSYSILRDAYESLNDNEVLIRQAILLVDLLRDEFNGVEEAKQRQWLTTLLKDIYAETRKQLPDSTTSRLLTRRAALLRMRRNRFDLSGTVKKRTLDEAVRCAQKAVDIQPSVGGQFELALCKWAIAADAKSDEEYNAILGEVERLLLDENIVEIEVARLALVQFYRLIYRPVECCELMSELQETARHKRRLLAAVHTYAEAAIHLWYQKFPAKLVTLHCKSAMQLTQMAIDSGYRNARNVVNLAMIRAILGDVEGGDTILHELAGMTHADIWNKLVEFALSPRMDDALSESLLLGITNGAVWTRLGTYAWTFSERVDVTRTMYEFAEKLNPEDPVVLTNLARFYIREQIDVPTTSIERLLQRADGYSDRRFKWWKSVWAELKKKDVESNSPDHSLESISRCSVTPKRLRDVRKQFQQLAKLSNSQKRGYELERVIYALAHLSFKVASAPYRFKRDLNTKTQVDGYIEHRGEKYRIECKWEKEPIAKKRFLQLLDALDVFGVSGLCISMSGFSDSFVQRVRERRGEFAILLVDGPEVQAMIDGEINFDELLTFKRFHFDKNSNPYAHFEPIQA